MHVEGGRHLDVAHMIAPKLDVHEPGRRLVGRRLGVVGEALHEGGGAVADADETHANLVLSHERPGGGAAADRNPSAGRGMPHRQG
jgi:hypothetical protein